MRICYLSEEYPPETRRGGIGTYTREIACAVAQLGHEVNVITKTHGDPYDTEAEGVLVHRIPRPTTGLDDASHRVADLLARSLAVFTKVQELNSRHPFDIIEAPEIGSEALHLAFRRDFTLVTRFHTPTFLVRELNPHQAETVYPYTSPFPETADVLERLQALGSAGVTSISRSMARVISQRWDIPIDRITVVPNPFNPDAVIKEDSAIYESMLKDTDYVLYFGRLEERKGVHVLAQALPSIFQRFPTIKAAFVGEDMGYGRSTMKDWVLTQNRGYEDRLIFVGHTEHESLFPIIRNAKLVILPSLWEALGYTCLESMALGKVVVATRGSGFEEIIDHGQSGFLVRPNDPADIASTVQEVLPRDLSPIERKSKARFLDFDSRRIAQRMVACYEELIGKSHAEVCRKGGSSPRS